MSEVTAPRTSGVSRRHGPVVEDLGFASRYVLGQGTRTEPATAAAPPRPHGELGHAPIGMLADLARDTWDGHEATVWQRAQGTREILRYLLGFPGATWQQRWDASPLGRGEITASSLGSRRAGGIAVSPGLRSLLCLRVIQPSHLAFRVNPFQNYPEFFSRAQHDPLLDKFIEHAGSLDAPWGGRDARRSTTCAAC